MGVFLTVGNRLSANLGSKNWYEYFLTNVNTDLTNLLREDILPQDTIKLSSVLESNIVSLKEKSIPTIVNEEGVVYFGHRNEVVSKINGLSLCVNKDGIYFIIEDSCRLVGDRIKNLLRKRIYFKELRYYPYRASIVGLYNNKTIFFSSKGFYFFYRSSVYLHSMKNSYEIFYPIIKLIEEALRLSSEKNIPINLDIKED